MYRVFRISALGRARVVAFGGLGPLPVGKKMCEVASCGGTSTAASEGKAVVHLPAGVFYNPVQQFNRDITVALIRHFQLCHQHEWLQRIKRKIQGGKSQVSTIYQGLRILEALSATGIRSVRFALEVPFVDKVVANDLDPKAALLIRENVYKNRVENYVDVTCEDAIDLMHKHRLYETRFSVVDIDPYGTASPFLDSAVQCLHDGGLLCVTSTDMAVLCGSTPGTSMGKYGAVVTKNSSPHETGLRVLLHSIQQAASRHSRVIEPLISLSVDFYARVFVRLWSSPGAVKSIAAKHAICYTCSGCGAYHIQPLGHAIPGPRRVAPARGPPVGPSCAECNSPFLVSGPLWNGPLHSRSFLRSFLDALGAAPDLAKSDEVMKPPHENASVATENGKQSDPTENNYPLVSELLSQLPEGYSYSSGLTKPELPTDLSHTLGTFKRIVGMCTVAYEELPDVTLCYRSDHLSAVLGTVIPPMLDLYSALLNAGYRVSSSHTDMNVFKTDAPISFIWDVFLTYRNRIKSEEGMNIDQKRLPLNECNSDKKDHHDSDSDHDDAVNPSNYLESNRQRKRRLRRSRSGGDFERDGLQAEEVEENYRHNRHIVRAKLLSRPLNPRVDFTIHPLANPPSRVAGLIRYQMKPEKFWGPKARPKLSKTES